MSAYKNNEELTDDEFKTAIGMCILSQHPNIPFVSEYAKNLIVEKA